jgi:hypothetical protein
LMTVCPTLMRADTIALSFTGGSLGNAGQDLTFGYAFTLSSSVLVTQLGLWDQGNDGLNTSHDVTIWTSTGTQEARFPPSRAQPSPTASAMSLSRPSFCPPVVTQSRASTPPTAIYSPFPLLRLRLLPGLPTMVLGPKVDSRFRRVTSLASRTPTSARISNLRYRHPTLARQFLCSAALCSAWRCCGANCAAKVLVAQKQQQGEAKLQRENMRFTASWHW